MSILRRVTSSLPEYPSGAQSVFGLSDIEFDYAIGGMAFLSAAAPDKPLVRQTAPYRKDQVDTATTPGEQSLVSWWIRSQNTFHRGTGIVFEEPDISTSFRTVDPSVQERYADSVGLDPWTAGKVTLLKATSQLLAVAGTSYLAGGNDGTVDCWVQSDGTALKRVTAAGVTSTVTWGGAGPILNLADDGSNYYAADATGIYQGTLAGGAGSKIWNTGSSRVVVGWAKQRLVAGIGASFYELTGTGPTLPTAKYTHPNAAWTWTAVAESPSAIYAAGYAGIQSAIYKFVLDTQGNVPTLTSGIITASLAVGEYVTALFSYLGTFVAIGTNRGVRIGVIDTNGDISVGPLTVDFSKLSSTPTDPVYGFAGKDRYIFFTLSGGIAGKTGLGRIDLGIELYPGVFAWATDLQSHVTGTSRDVLIAGTTNRLVQAVDAQGGYVESATALETTGYLLTGNIRFHTLESKLFKYALIRTAPLTGGSVLVSVIDHNGVEVPLATFSVTGADTSQEMALPTSLGKQEYVALRFTLNRDVGTTVGPEFRSYQLKALPGAKRQRFIKLPLLCFDFERDREGHGVGYEGRAKDRLQALEQLEEVGDVVSFQDLSRDPFENRLVVIDDITFVQVSPPASASGWGGVAEITLRTVT